MEQEKPFKTIEVVDSRTSQVCKIACMSCIRGHRTTSCGIPVCRNKVFWTVKRPGRPSSSCTCRYGATGGCKCVVARSACPHKSKKGEKRSGECRCDEQGRYCCTLDPEHWNILLALGKPTVNFYPTREALEATQPPVAEAPPTPAYSAMTCPPPTLHSMPNTPGPDGHIQPTQTIPCAYNAYAAAQHTTLSPRFGTMGVGTPVGTQHDIALDVLTWQGQAPPAPREFKPVFEDPPQESGSCCQPSTPATNSPRPRAEHSYPQFMPINSSNHTPSGTHEHAVPGPISPQVLPALDFDRLQKDYLNYQFPGAICQNCGLNGCTCKNCPPPFQSYGNGSWAQCCGRKHARDIQPSPAPVKVARTESYSISVHSQAQQRQVSMSLPQDDFTQAAPFHLDAHDFASGFVDVALPSAETRPDFSTFDIDDDLLLPDGTQPLDMSEFLNSDLDRLNHDPIDRAEQSSGARSGLEPEGVGGGGGGGCCCQGP